jgi:predicted MFS family arabinose efflux permease
MGATGRSPFLLQAAHPPLQFVAYMNTQSSNFPRAALLWLAAGAFAVGTEGFMIAGMLPSIASDLGTTVAAAGQLVTVFAFAYAISSPVLTALTGSINRRTLLILAMLVFTAANLIAASATGYWGLMAARVLLAFAAGIYVPGANALAGVIVVPERRGKAIAIINGGLTVAIALGVPMGTLMATHLGWRSTFVGVAGLAAIATGGLWFGLNRSFGANLPVASLRERIAVARQPSILLSLLVTTLWATGAYTVYTYLALFVGAVTPLHGAQVGWILFTWGVAAGVGVTLGGPTIDRIGSRSVIVPTLLFGALAFLALSLTAYFVPHAWAIVPVVVAVIVWGIAHWSFYPAQQVRLIGLAGTRAAPIATALNASFMYLGFSLGAATGSLTLMLGHGVVGNLGWVAALFELAALVLMLRISRPQCAASASPLGADARAAFEPATLD